LGIAEPLAKEHNPGMQSFTTKGATDLLYADDYRSNGCPDVWCLQNESGTVELGALTQEVESALEDLELKIDSDVIPDQIMTSLIEHLNTTRVLDIPVSY
jgi:hypothetical protein